MATVADVITQLSLDLNDPFHDAWTVEQLEAYLREGIQNVFLERADLFTEVKVIRLDPCTVRQSVCDCERIIRVIGQTDANGRVIKGLRRKMTKDSLVWPRTECATSPAKFRLREYRIDNDTSSFWVYPEPPAGQDTYVSVECSVAPTDFDGAVELHPEVEAAALQWAFYRACMVDGENNATMLNRAQIHRDTFYALLGIQRAVQAQEKADDGSA